MLVWKPSEERIAKANLTRFIAFVRARYIRSVEDFLSLYQWSVQCPENFWAAAWEFFGIRASRRWDVVLADRHKMPGAQWFSGSRLNFAENLLRSRSDREALVFWNELGRQRALSYSDLHREVSRVSAGLRDLGIRPGDRVAGFLPNLPETVIAMLAATAIGAVWSSCSPDFGVKGVLDRFGQIRPRVLFVAGGYVYGGKRFALTERVREIARNMPGIEKIVVVDYLNRSQPHAFSERGLAWEELGSRASSEMRFEQLPFDHPTYVMYSSGTTGLPKCMVHGAGGTLIQHLKELVLHTDLKPDSRIFYYTTCGWMMWNWLVSSLAAGATVILYDGSPFHPHDAVLFDLAEYEKMTVFGTSARYLALAEKRGLRPRVSHDLGHLATILSTGSPLAPTSFDYVYRDVKKDVCLSSISGGTDLISCFALGNPIGPVYRGELQTPGLGMKVEVFDEKGDSLTGQKGELVCTMPFPSMPVKFWNDPDGEKYRRAYFDIYPGVWRHGDWAEITEHQGLVIYGRSDATLNPGGVRIGTAEIYRVVEEFEEVLESVVVGQRWEDDVRIVLFLRLREGQGLDEDLRLRIRQKIRNAASPHHVPKKIIQVADIPRTISGKITELAVEKVIHGRVVENVEALANPESLELFRDLPELQE